MTGPVLAAITLHPSGGGIAGVSRLLWQTMQIRWGATAELVTLLADAVPASLEPSSLARIAFAGRVASRTLGSADWICFSHLALAKALRVIPLRGRRPYVVFLHGIEAWRTLETSEAQLLASATLRVANSEYTAARVRAAHPAVGGIAVCPLAVPPPFASPGSTGPDRALAAIGPRAVVIVARLSAAERYKGHDALLDAWPSVVARQPEAQLVIVGTGDDAPRLQAKARTLGVGGQVVFTGFVDDVSLAALYRRAALLAMPSRGEGFGLAYLEAMSHGLPCIGSIHDAAGEVIEDGVTGFLVDQADSRALSARILQLLEDDGRRRAMGEAGRRRVGERFTAGQFTARFGALVDATLGGKVMTPQLAQGSR